MFNKLLAMIQQTPLEYRLPQRRAQKGFPTWMRGNSLYAKQLPERCFKDGRHHSVTAGDRRLLVDTSV